MGRALGLLIIAVLLAPLRVLHAQEAPPPTSEAEAPPVALAGVQLHGFVSQGAFITTSNNYLGRSTHGSAEFTEAALNVSSEVADRLRVGLQLFTRDVARD